MRITFLKPDGKTTFWIECSYMERDIDNIYILDEIICTERVHERFSGMHIPSDWTIIMIESRIDKPLAEPRSFITQPD
jgi:hypothetical protein